MALLVWDLIQWSCVYGTGIHCQQPKTNQQTDKLNSKWLAFLLLLGFACFETVSYKSQAGLNPCRAGEQSQTLVHGQ